MDTKTNKEVETFSIGSELGKKVHCSMCNKEGKVEDFIKSQNAAKETVYICQDCKSKVNDAFKAETENANMFGAVSLGVVAGIVSGIVWYYVAVLTGYEIGYLALGMGYLVGMGVHLGSGKKRGQNLQIISAIIAFLTIVITEKFIVQHGVSEYIAQNPTQFEGVDTSLIKVSVFSPLFWTTIASPIGLLIYAFGIYVASKICKPRSM